jgi:hypothetical protein
MWKKSTRERMTAFYIVVLSKKILRNALFVDSTDSIIEKKMVMMRTAIKENASIKRPFGTLLSLLI